MAARPLIPLLEQYGLQLDIEAHPYDFSERNDDAVQIIRGLNRPWINYCGIAAVCVFGWEEDADAIHRRMLDRVTAELARPACEPR